MEDGETKGHELWAYGAIKEDGLSRLQEFEFVIKSGLYTPLSMKTSDSFHVIIYNNGLREINYVRKAMSLTMKQGKDVGSIQLIPGNSINGSFTDHTLRFLSPAPIYKDFLIMVYIPEEVGAPMDQNFDCKVASPISQANSVCIINGQRVTLTVAIDES